MKKLVVITGPTAVGKTELSIRLAEEIKTEIVSCDSRQMYREMSIGTAVPVRHQLNRVKHHFIHNISIHDDYNAYSYEVAALQLLEKLFSKFPMVIVTGGSGLYLNALLYGIDDLPTIDRQVRFMLEERLKKEGIESLRIDLKKTDPAYYDQVDLKNPKRILKALEVFAMTGKAYSTFLTQNTKKRGFEIVLVGLNKERTELHLQIENRVDQMMEEGLQEEARKLYSNRNLNALNTVGYRELFDFLDGKQSLAEAVELIKRNTRRYARRQLTWFRKYENMNWFHTDQLNAILAFVKG